MKEEKISEQEKQRIEEYFIKWCIKSNIKFKSKKFYLAQESFFVGAVIGLNSITGLPPHWYMCIISGREIVKY